MDKNNTTKEKPVFFIDKGTVERFVAVTTGRSMAVKERLNQKCEKIIDKIPGLGKAYRKLQDFDEDMEKKHGKVYVKIRKSVYNISRTVLAAQMFGLPGIVGICACKMCENAAGFLEPAEKARQEGKVSGIFEYLNKNKEEAAVSSTNSALTVAAAACEVAGAVGVEEAVRAGKASLLLGTELKSLGKTFGKWIRGKASFKDVKRDAVVAGITFATYFASDAPLTRGEPIKPEEETKSANKEDKSAVAVPNEEAAKKASAPQKTDAPCAQDAEKSGTMLTLYNIKAQNGGR